jgi:hypothetical protein
MGPSIRTIQCSSSDNNMLDSDKHQVHLPICWHRKWFMTRECNFFVIQLYL